MRTALAFSFLTLAAGAQAAVDCQFNGRPVVVSESFADFHTNSLGKRDVNGYLSMFRLLTMDESDGGPNSVELKTIDVTKPGRYALSKDAGWRSQIDVQGDTVPTTGGEFNITRLEVRGSTGRAAGTVTFSTAKVNGSCRFDVELVVVDRGPMLR
ncbi:MULTISPECIES: hypothetical protein [unclassified Roseateles]|uniref:hypothetical protein n=1 Tax=unclassified Roseateles TaxID=2626991 RepID=UPI0006F89C7D|nr:MULTISPECIES: hypothetical protein [unclassified Roseateles]KQW51461.1 hypothetical protein ASC81_02120 [Pelomonas sp. Root405]KRA77693.1 hypothetical protein ASD88_02120 [Pelomonas sp. Root662]